MTAATPASESGSASAEDSCLSSCRCLVFLTWRDSSKNLMMPAKNFDSYSF